MNILFKQSNNGHRKAINVNYKTLYFAKKSTANVVIYRLNTIQKTFSFLASLLNDHVSPSSRGKEDITMSSILGQYKKKCSPIQSQNCSRK